MQNFSRTALFLLCWFVLLSQIARAGGLPGSNGKAMSGYLAQFADVVTRVIAADNEMWEQLKFVSKRLDNFYFKHGYFPRTQDEQDRFSKMLTKHIVANPYQPRAVNLATSQEVRSDTTVSMYFLIDAAVSPESVRNWVKNPPPSWKGDPGSIYMLSNGDDYYVLWAASADRFPMRDLQHTNKMRVIAHRCAQSAQ